jgi:hypothetical protein
MTIDQNGEIDLLSIYAGPGLEIGVVTGSAVEKKSGVDCVAPRTGNGIMESW